MVSSWWLTRPFNPLLRLGLPPVSVRDLPRRSGGVGEGSLRWVAGGQEAAAGGPRPAEGWKMGWLPSEAQQRRRRWRCRCCSPSTKPFHLSLIRELLAYSSPSSTPFSMSRLGFLHPVRCFGRHRWRLMTVSSRWRGVPLLRPSSKRLVRSWRSRAVRGSAAQALDALSPSVFNLSRVGGQPATD